MFSGEKRKGQLNNGSMFSSPLTSRRMKFLTVLLTPANRKNKWWVSAAPEVITLRPTVKMKPQSGALYPDYGTNTNVRRVLWVDRLQFHVLFESARRLVFKIDKRIFLWIDFSQWGISVWPSAFSGFFRDILHWVSKVIRDGTGFLNFVRYLAQKTSFFLNWSNAK